MSSGLITDLNGSSLLAFPDAPIGDYHLTVVHRNHLAIMSKNPVTLGCSTPPLYDFTLSQDAAYKSVGTSQPPMVQLCNSSLLGMIAGDGDGNYLIQANDLNNVWESANGLLGYYGGDSNLDTSVDSYDRNQLIAPNFGSHSYLPFELWVGF